MTKMSRYALITALAMFLAGCVGQREPAPVEEVKPAPEQPAEPQQPVPTVPSVPTIPQQPGPIEHEDQTAPPGVEFYSNGIRKKSEVLGDHIDIAQFFTYRFKERKSGTFPPSAELRCLISVRNSIIRIKCPEVIYPYNII